MLSELRRHKLDNQFRLLDTDGDGRIGRTDHQALVARLCGAFGRAPDGPDGTRLGAAFERLYGTDGEELTLEEFRTRMAVPDAFAIVARPLVSAVMTACDVDGDGELDTQEFRTLMTAWGLPPAHADQAFRDLDIDDSGQISSEELLEAMEEFYLSEDPHAPGTRLFGPIRQDAGPRARIPYPDPGDLPPETRQVLSELPQLNIFRMLAHAHTAFPACMALGRAILAQLELPGDLRELAVLQVAQELDATYVWTQHVGAARAESTARSKIVAIRNGRLDSPALTEAEQAALCFTREMLHHNDVSDAAFERLRRSLTDRQIVELLIVTGVYTLVSRVTTALALDADRGHGDQVVGYARGG